MTELPVGEPADPTPAARPVPRRLEGRYLSLVPVDPDAHTPPLYRGSHGDADAVALWTYMAYGPFRGLAAMRAWLAELAASTDPVFLTPIDRSTASPVGVVSFMNVDPRCGGWSSGTSGTCRQHNAHARTPKPCS